MTDIASKIEAAMTLVADAQAGAHETVKASLRKADNWLQAALDNQKAVLGPEPGKDPPPPLAPGREG